MQHRNNVNKYRNTSDQLTFDFDKIDIKHYLKVTRAVKKSFSLEEAGELIHGFDETFQDFKSGTQVVGLEWDIWSGYIVVAQNEEAESLAREIAEFIESWQRNMQNKAISRGRKKLHSFLAKLFRR